MEIENPIIPIDLIEIIQDCLPHLDYHILTQEQLKQIKNIITSIKIDVVDNSYLESVMYTSDKV